MLDSAYSVRSTRLSRTCPHGYLRPSLVTIWRRFGMATDSAQSARGSVLSAFPVDGTPNLGLGPSEEGMTTVTQVGSMRPALGSLGQP